MRASGLHLATSADVGADASRVVGYGAFAFEYSASARLEEADRELLLSACMAALGVGGAERAASRRRSSLNARSPALSPWRATFVTLTESGRLRGCIGSPAPRRPLSTTRSPIRRRRASPIRVFPRSKEAELAGLRLDVSILSHPRPIPAESESRTRRARSSPTATASFSASGRRRALFLPSVWRQLPDARAFVRHLMAKAGLEANGWPEGLEAMRFRVELFGAPWRRVDSKEIAA